MLGNGAWNRKDSSDKRKIFKTGDCRELGCSKPRRFTLGEGSEGWLKL